ncbi:hypothetical protein [Acetobacter orientalis]|uniref:hypothetical protein n=1 Tax=Acetobacter orientalis TaxID=146474 RepID=UPI00241DCA48|nr:hypothetical protein [Acetobacter orientalis]
MTTDVATNSHSVTPLVTAGEALFATISGKPLSDNVLKVTSGVTSLLDGLFPTLAEKAPFDLDGVFIGATEVLTGLNTAVVAAKAKTAAVTATTTPTVTGGA